MALYHGALRLAHDMCDPVFGLQVAENYRFGKLPTSQALPTDISQNRSSLVTTLGAMDAALLGFYIGRSELYVFLLSKSTGAVFSVTSFDVKQLDDLIVNNWYSPCKDFRDNPTPSSREVWRGAILSVRDMLEQLLWKAKTVDGVSLHQALSGLNVKRLVMAPHRHSVVFPIELLRLDGQDQTAIILGDRFETFNVRSLEALARLEQTNWRRFNKLLLIRSRGEVLPGAELEQRAIQSGPWQCSVQFAEAISIKEFASIVSEHDAIHISCHAFVRKSKDMYPSIEFADGYFSVEDIRQLALGHLKLASIATCDSAMTSIDAMDSTSGLMDAFIEAGCNTVNACLWPVPDLSTGLLFAEFYVALAQGCVPTVAMCRAKNWVRRVSIEELSERLRQSGLMSLAMHSSPRDKALHRQDLESVGMVIEANTEDYTPILEHPYFWAPFVVTIS